MGHMPALHRSQLPSPDSGPACLPSDAAAAIIALGLATLKRRSRLSYEVFKHPSEGRDRRVLLEDVRGECVCVVKTRHLLEIANELGLAALLDEDLRVDPPLAADPKEFDRSSLLAGSTPSTSTTALTPLPLKIIRRLFWFPSTIVVDGMLEIRMITSPADGSEAAAGVASVGG
eukprot:CAMPEP_0119509942 /NCGR_PEP_ID=MMETSP1344-20130328/29067_1 /TAXON_ID=236787 /ORGANISM="Florenciella parvula, Strain CCMP2471" /LENGTH=173 /DNA_ID=CAMNT_0007546821 /DNA_START=58 /DNA_END=576 /DNA_ORIENTATION=-